MQKCRFRTMWMFPRNIRRIEPWKLVQIAQLLEASEGDIRDQGVQDQLYGALSALGVKVAANEARVANSGGFRTYLAQLACLGFFWKDPVTKQFSTTYAGECLIEAKDPLTLLRCQLLRMQFPSVYGLGPNVAISPNMHVKPFRFLIKLLMDERLGFRMTCDEMAVPVIYGRREEDYEKCVEKILKMRASGGVLDSVLDSVDDVRTPKRCNYGDPDGDRRKGLIDAVEIANTAKNYLIAAVLVTSCVDAPKSFELIGDEEIYETIASWLTEPVEKLDERFEAAWQQRFGRFNQTKAVRSLKKRTVNGFEALIRTRFISGVSENPFGFDVDDFVGSEAERWGKKREDVARIIDPIRHRVSSLEREVVMRAAYSGGKEAIVLEKAVTSIFRRLGFDWTRHCGQLRSDRLGGYPDVWIQAKGDSNGGWIDTKATMKYDFPVSDINKLGQYYKHCEKELDSSAQAAFFMYVAGGFSRSAEAVRNRLSEGAKLYERPVSALTVSALLDLVGEEEKPSPEKLAKAFATGGYFADVSGILEKTRN